MSPLVSVLIDTYNHERYIAQAIVSAVEQGFPASDFEVVVVDDGSTDRTPEIVRKFAPRVRLLRKRNGGQASAFNTAIPELRGQIVSFLDGDDWFAPGKLATVMTALEEHPEVDAVGHGYYEYDERTASSVIRAPAEGFYADISSPEAARIAYSAWPFLIMGSLTARRAALTRLGRIRHSLTFCADSPIALGCAASGVWICPGPFCYYRHHTASRYADRESSAEKLRISFQMKQRMYAEVEVVLRRLGVPEDCIIALIYGPWIQESRNGLRKFGGSRIHALRTEMRAFRSEHRNPSAAYRLFKYIGVGAATLILPPRRFYEFRDWYGSRDLGKLRESLLKSVAHDRCDAQVPANTRKR